jgi:DNA mismatch endonuclease (patch repair protein)
MGYRFSLRYKGLPCKPDIVLPKHKAVIFVHGCFWHRHKGCRDATTPGSRTKFWETKFSTNVARDKRNQKAIWKLGWKPLVVWECELRDPVRLARKLALFVGTKSSIRYDTLPDRHSLRKVAEAKADYNTEE